MPVIEPDELLARTDEWLENTPAVVHAGTVQMVERLAAALRAALATRPQPLFEGTIDDLSYVIATSYGKWSADQQVVVYPASAGSATPTKEDDDG